MNRKLNLLPPGRRLSLRQEVLLSAANRFLRRVAVSLAVLTVLAALAGVGMWGASLLTGRTAEAELAQQVAAYHKLKSEIDSQNALLELVDDRIRGRNVWSDLIPDLLDIVPPGITIDALRAGEETKTITFSGTAGARSSLVVFEERLRLLPWVQEMTAPRTNLLGRVDAAYTFGLTVKDEGNILMEEYYGDVPPEP
ncbi:MAG: hypothetical protein ABIH36_01820 [bacterium]